MAFELYVNDPGTTLASAITTTFATSISVASSTGFPSGGNFRILIGSELMLVTAVSGTTWTVTRNIESTTAATHLSGAAVNMVATAGMLDQIRQDAMQTGPFASLPASSKAGSLYLPTDSMYSFLRDNGGSWDPFCQGKKLVDPSAQSFSWHNMSTAVLTTANGGEQILSAIGANANNVNARFVAYPTPPFTRTLAIQVTPAYINGATPPTNGSGGLYLSDGTKVEYFGIYGLSQLAIQSGPTMTNINNNVITPRYTGLLNSIMWFRMDDGVNTSGQRTFWYSFDGVNFFQFWQESNTAILTPTRIGFFAQAFDTGSFVNSWALGWE